MTDGSSAPWEGFDQQDESQAVKELDERVNALLDQARALIVSVGDYEFAERQRQRAAILDRAEERLTTLEAMLAMGAQAPQERWGKRRRVTLDDVLIDPHSGDSVKRPT
jgi:hypothetical protein